MSVATQWLKREVRIARRDVRKGRFDRSMALMTAFAALVSGWEAYAQHMRGAFSHWLMWTPVWLTPPTVVAGLAGVVSQRVAQRVLPVLALATIADGVIGFVFHIRGIQSMPGGFRLGRYNIVMGPPIFAPLLMCTVGLLGLLAGFVRAERVAIAHLDRFQFQRPMALLTAFFAVLAGGEAYAEHLRGSFNRPIMWTPVWLTPPMAIACVSAVFSQSAAHRVLPLASSVTFLDGMLGFVLHLQGIRRMPGGFSNLEFNSTMGPPLFAPLLFSSVGLLGFVAALVGRKRGR